VTEEKGRTLVDELASIKRVVSRARAHVGSARTALNEAVKVEAFEDYVDEAQTRAAVAQAEAMTALASLAYLMFKEGRADGG
jgi:hypothetical protein